MQDNINNEESFCFPLGHLFVALARQRGIQIIETFWWYGEEIKWVKKSEALSHW